MLFVLPKLTGNPEGGDGNLFIPLDCDGPLSDLVLDGALEDFFWAGTTLWDICFNDLKELREYQQQLGLPGAPHHNDGMGRTTFDDILRIFSTVRPPLVGPEQPYIPSPTDPINGWVLTYLDGDGGWTRKAGILASSMLKPVLIGAHADNCSPQSPLTPFN
ncbi:hypothetical protein B0T26DRAFT_753290 [Lasiosphaeria miniovina]|uniref:Uncharacterized protein n=1 Tax=Lasiosphaeria miniovina TaxID=1954250 RepID=A0AA40AC35_9PEZI|nr:uncharacterized protein B0T26DRAFT_753290 [Lasiosphaeria miniovina]KAK0713146.1 hypothetical protein B0T26DRAFT_753290 [Lasiosphaeria miniovina]